MMFRVVAAVAVGAMTPSTTTASASTRRKMSPPQDMPTGGGPANGAARYHGPGRYRHGVKSAQPCGTSDHSRWTLPMRPGKASVVAPASVLDDDFSVAVASTGRSAPNGSVPSLPHG